MNFDRIAPCYRALEFALAGPILQWARTRWLGVLAERPRIRTLVAGEGHGRGVESILRVAPAAEITVVEASSRMIAVAQARLRRAGLLDGAGIRWIASDVRAWTAPAGCFDAIVTQFFLDCFDARGVERVVHELARAATGDAVWLLSDFRLSPHGWRRARAKAIHALMYFFFRRVVGLEADRVTSPEPALRAAGFRLNNRAESCAGLIHSEVWKREPRLVASGQCRSVYRP